MIIVKFNDTLKGREWYTSFNASCSAGDIFYKMSFNFYAKTVSLHATRFFSFLDLLQLLYNFLEFTHTHNQEKLSVSWTWLVVVKRGTRLRIIFQIILILILISRNRKLCNNVWQIYNLHQPFEASINRKDPSATIFLFLEQVQLFTNYI